jgi:hypothetical protein
MEITYQTNISELINVDQAQDQVSSIESVIDEYSNRGNEVLREQLASNLSETSFYYGTNHPIFDKATSIIFESFFADKTYCLLSLSSTAFSIFFIGNPPCQVWI